MSMYFREHGCCVVLDYSKDGRTKQTFKAETDINTILKRFSSKGVISHLAKFKPQYGDFGGSYDFAESLDKLNKGQGIFDALPSEVRREFDQDPGKFFDYVNDPGNSERLDELMPEIAERGDYFPDYSPKTPPGSLLAGGEPGPVEVPKGDEGAPIEESKE